MAIDNTVTVTGNVTRDPELRFTPTGQAVCSFGIAVNRRWQNRQTQEWEEQVSFFDITAWSQLGQNVADSISRGTRVTVTGRLDQRAWENAEGEKRSKVEIVADDVAASVRWATVEVVKNERSDGPGSGGRSFGGSAPASTPAPAPAYNPDEEPF